MIRLSNYFTVLLLSCALCGSLAWSQETPDMVVNGQSTAPAGTPLDRSMCEPGGPAVGGFDLITYRAAGGPIPGKPEFSAPHDGSMYLFSTQSNLETFLADPKRYVPAYHGFCAITLALGRVVCPDPTNFVIQDDRLFLFEVTGFTNGRTLWNTDPVNFRKKADTNYSNLVIK